MKFLVLIPSLSNCWKLAFESVMRQVQPKDGVFVLVAQDGEGEIPQEYQPLKFTALNGNWKHLVWCRDGRHYAAKNIHDGIIESGKFGLEKTDVVVHIDGDDPGLFGNSVFGRLAHIYSDKNVWLTYGSYLRKSDNKVIGKSYQNGEVFRESPWKASHLRTYRYGLISKVPENCYKDRDGNWLKVCADLATMFPMMEMAGQDRIVFINKPMYIYDNTLPTNDYKMVGEEQQRINRFLRSRCRFERLEKL